MQQMDELIPESWNFTSLGRSWLGNSFPIPVTVLSFSASQVGEASAVGLFHSPFGKNCTLHKKDYTG